jgi:tape measure domain-containing protein
VAVSVVDVQVNAQGAVRGLNQVNIASRAAEAGVSSLKGAVLGLTAGFTALSAIRLVVGKTAELEKQTRSFETLTGSVEEAKRIIADLQQLGAVTPFTSSELIDAAKRLQAFGVEAKDVVATTRRLADVSGATGAELQGLVTAFGQVQAKGRLQGEELLQFQERGIALQEELRRMYGMTGEEFQKALSKGRISAEAVEVAIINLTDKGGKYANGAIAQSTTLEGKFSTLTDGVDEVARKIGQTLQPALKEILDLAIQVINKINQALAGPDYKKANDQLFNTRARITELKTTINQAQKAGIGLAQGLQVLGTDGQVLGGGQPVLPGLRFELQQLEADAKRLEGRLSELRRAAAPEKPTPKPETPSLLGEDKKPRAKGSTLDQLLGGDIKRDLDKARADLEIATAQRLGDIAGKPGMEQAERMIEFASKYRDVQLQIDAVEKTLAARAGVRAMLISQSTDKTSTALAFDEQSRDLQNQRNILLGQFNKLSAEQGKQSRVQYATEAERAVRAIESITAEIAYKQNILALGEEEADQRRRIAELVAQGADPKLAAQKVKDETEVNKKLLERQFLLQQEQQLLNAIGSTFTSTITGLIQGTNDFNSSLQNVLKSLGNLLIQAGLQGLAGNDGRGFFSFLSGSLGRRAMGGSVTAGQGYLVGERGPELFMPGRSGGIAPAGSFGGMGNVVVNVDAGGSSVQGDPGQASQLGKVIGLAVQQELIKQKRPGGLLS